MEVTAGAAAAWPGLVFFYNLCKYIARERTMGRVSLVQDALLALLTASDRD